MAYIPSPFSKWARPIGQSTTPYAPMITKSFDIKKKVLQATFTCHAPSYAQYVSLCGDFNAWHPGSNSMSRNDDGTFTASIELPVDSRIAFKYIDDHHQWFNDDAADAYEPNAFGEWNSIVLTNTPADLKPKAETKASAVPKTNAKAAPAKKSAAKKAATKAAPAKKAAAKKKA